MKRDGRKLSSAEQLLQRKNAVNMFFEEGYTKTAIAAALGASRNNVSRWCSLYEAGGMDALELGRRGRRPNEQAKLSWTQCGTIVRTIQDKTPDQLRLAFVLWAAAAVRDFIHTKFQVTFHIRTVRKYLRKWGFTPQKPVKKSWQQSDPAVRRWLEEDYPEIARKAKRKGATIFWVDEVGATNQANAQRGYAPKGKTPELKKSGKKCRVNMVSAVTNKGELRFMCYTATMTQSKFILFLSKLLRSTDGPVVAITDNLPVHHGKRVKAWVGQQPGIELEFIPSYSPELNADEYLNRDLKTNVNAKRMPKNLAELKENVMSFMLSIQKQPARITKYFHGRCIAYAS
jgi:transposase